MPHTVAVIGAGVNGLSSAVNIIEQIPDVNVTIISAEFSPNTTGDGAAGFWEPYRCGDTPEHLQSRWGEITFRHVEALLPTAESAVAGITTVSGYQLDTKPMPEDPPWSKTVYNFRRVPTAEVTKLFPDFSHGIYFTSLLCEGRKYLPWLMARFKRSGGRIVQKKIEDIKELQGQYDVVVNCTGVQARSLVNDTAVQPIRGQLIRVHAPWIKHFVINISDFITVLPCANNVVLGGTAQVGNWNREVDQIDRKKIFESCCKVYPSLKHATIDYEWVGLRPGRTSIRLEKEILNVNGRKMKIVHNYGHGGSGVTFHWGCAQDTTDLVAELLGKKTRRSSKARL